MDLRGIVRYVQRVSPLCVIQPLFKPTNYDLVDNFSLPVPLWICWGGISVCYAQITTIPSKGLAIKLQSIIRDECMRDSKQSDNILPNKFLSIRISDICQRLHFNPLSKVIYADQQISFIPYCFRKRTYNVQSLLRKRPRAGQWVKDSYRLMNVWCKSLTLITLLHIFLCFLLHVRPPIALCEGPVRQRPAPRVASTNPFV